MIERIREILSARQLTPTQFADTIGVARPIVSHILSGRNKPSLDVVQKIIEAFPDLSMAWILLGAGPMEAAEPAGAALPPQPEPQPSPRTSAKGAESAAVATKSRPTATSPTKVLPTQSAATFAAVLPEPAVPAEAPLPAGGAAPAPAAAELPISASQAALPATSPAEAPTPKAAPVAPDAGPHISPLTQAFAEPGKAIRRIVIFYQDGTFTDYRPE